MRIKNGSIKIGIVDTMFARINMGKLALDELSKYSPPGTTYKRRTVPGIKDLAVVCEQLLDKTREEKCNIVIALGMVGGAPIDNQCGHEASLGIQMAKLLTGKQIIEVFVHENEAWSEKEFFEIVNDRIRKHVRNAVDIIKKPGLLIERAGKGIRQGKENEGSINIGIENKGEETLVGIVVGTFHKGYKKMLDISKQILLENNIEYIINKVPGTFDVPLITKKLLMNKKINGIVVLGAIEKGKTLHGEMIGNTTAKTLQELSLQFNKPVTLGIVGPGATQEQIQLRIESHATRATKALIYLINELKR